LSRKGFEADALDDYKGLNRRNPWFAFVMLLVMFGLAGVPPTVGFWAKLQVIAAVLDVDLTWLAALAVLMSVVGAYYYLRIVKLMYFDEPTVSGPVEAKLAVRLLLSLNALAILVLGLYPGLLLRLCENVVP
jgi:NADH-quinone oxidoreductase subunit N